jgi:hypothetical protein
MAIPPQVGRVLAAARPTEGQAAPCYPR